MQVEYPYLVGRMHVPPRCRNARMCSFEESRTVTIPEATDEEAPVCFLRNDPYRDDLNRAQVQVTEYRWWNEQVWINRHIRYDSRNTLEPTDPFESDIPRRPQESPRDGHLEEQPWWDRHFANWESRRLIVNGQWFHRTTEPLYYIDLSETHYAYDRNRLPIRVRQVDGLTGSRNTWHYYYPLNWKAICFEHAAILARKLNRPTAPDLPRYEYRVLLRDAIRRQRYQVYEFELGSPSVSMRLLAVGTSPAEAVEALQQKMRESRNYNIGGSWGVIGEIKLEATPDSITVQNICAIDPHVAP